jgi:hypothetical protein
MTKHQAGQAIRRDVEGGILNADNYPRKHLFIGDWKLSFPNGDPDVVFSGVNIWPTTTVNCPEGFVWEAQNDAMYYCVLPQSQLIIEVIDLVAGDTLVIPSRNLVFIPQDASWRLNGELQSGQQMVACENSSARTQAINAFRAFMLSVK